MKRIDLLTTRLRTYIDLLQVQLKLHTPGEPDYLLIETELDSIEVQLEFMLTIPDKLEPKQKGDIIWKFVNAVNIEVACNVPGHYQAGMIAKVNIK